MNKNLLKDSAKLKILTGDNADYTAEYREYSLSSVRVIERLGTTAEMTEKNTVYLYFFPSESVCKDENGNNTSLPTVKYGDIAVITVGEQEKTVRVAAVEKHLGIGCATHVRLRLE